jgi:hypothetical protein
MPFFAALIEVEDRMVFTSYLGRREEREGWGSIS